MKKSLFVSVMISFLVAGFAAPAISQQVLGFSGVININTATQAQLRMLPPIDHQLAHNIVMYRINNGPFFSIEELMKVRGMTQEKLEEIRPWLVTEGQTTFSPHLHREGTPGPVY